MNNCSENAKCTDTFEGFYCTCLPGFLDKSPENSTGILCEKRTNNCIFSQRLNFLIDGFKPKIRVSTKMSTVHPMPNAYRIIRMVTGVDVNLVSSMVTRRYLVVIVYIVSLHKSRLDPDISVKGFRS